MHQDLVLQQRISDELIFEPRINPANIGVSVRDGVTRLYGEVQNYAERQAAEAAVRRVKGVGPIVIELTVFPPSAEEIEDEQIAARGRQLLAWDVRIPDREILITVAGGNVTLEGEVDWHYQRAAIQEILGNLTGVKEVTNKITVRPARKAKDIHQEIRRALKRRNDLEAKDVVIRVYGDKVTLSGKAHSDVERQEIERTAWAARGVTDVCDHIVVD